MRLEISAVLYFLQIKELRRVRTSKNIVTWCPDARVTLCMGPLTSLLWWEQTEVLSQDKHQIQMHRKEISKWLTETNQNLMYLAEVLEETWCPVPSNHFQRNHKKTVVKEGFIYHLCPWRLRNIKDRRSASEIALIRKTKMHRVFLNLPKDEKFMTCNQIIKLISGKGIIRQASRMLTASVTSSNVNFSRIVRTILQHHKETTAIMHKKWKCFIKNKSTRTEPQVKPQPSILALPEMLAIFKLIVTLHTIVNSILTVATYTIINRLVKRSFKISGTIQMLLKLKIRPTLLVRMHLRSFRIILMVQIGHRVKLRAMNLSI